MITNGRRMLCACLEIVESDGPMSPDGCCHVAIRDQYIIGLPDPGPAGYIRIHYSFQEENNRFFNFQEG